MKLVEKKSKNGNYSCKIDDLGIYHRVDGPAKIMHSGMDEYWYFFGVEHRIGGPAVITSRGLDYERKEWYVNGLLHRLDGPAIDCKNYKQYCILGEYYTKAKFDKIIKNKALVKEIEEFVSRGRVSKSPEVVSKNNKVASESSGVFPMLAAATMLAGAGFVWSKKKSLVKPVQSKAEMAV